MGEWVRLIVSALPGVVAVITLIYQLVKYVRKAILEKNWPEIVQIVSGYMERAETMFEKGADRKEWVLAMVSPPCSFSLPPLFSEPGQFLIDVELIFHEKPPIFNFWAKIKNPLGKGVSKRITI